jgi:CTP synthase (UTP-ammonia lyase)
MVILNDFSTTVRRALEEIDPNYESYEGLVVCGTHNFHDVEMMIGEIKKARENGTPALLICAGHQLAWIEYCRNVLGIKDATSEEISNQGTFVVVKRPMLLVGLHDGESWWSNYRCVTENSNWDEWLDEHPNFISVPFHPEYQSSWTNPHKLLVKFIEYAKNKRIT